MALQSAFKERFEDMEFTRNQRLSLLQAEKDLQKNKSQLLSAKHSNISLLEQRCLIMDRQFASDNFRVSSLKSEIELLDRRYERLSRQLSHLFRELNVEVEELEELVKEREKFCAVKSAEMNEFTDRTEKFASDLRIKVDELKHRRDELKLFCSDAQNHDIQAAEKRKSELLALKEKIASTLETNKREQSELQKQLQSLR
ncbi:hypothetical protein RND81_08G011200 [Saponaria officinalis]|uniref:Uncharacterized protein n=1 Tax=Saponaria officinalis TaxID=3572 RepID=A0AAW1J2G7_SAPOF